MGFFRDRAYISKAGNKVFPQGWLSIGPHISKPANPKSVPPNHLPLSFAWDRTNGCSQFLHIPFYKGLLWEKLINLVKLFRTVLEGLFNSRFSLFSQPLIRFMPFLFAQQFITLVMVRCLSHRNDCAFSDRHWTCYKEQTQEKVGLTGYQAKTGTALLFFTC